MGSLDGKVALITGGAGGLGSATARRFVADGATVVITDIQVELGEQVAAETGAHFLPQDITDEARWDEVVDEIITTHGGLDVLVNNAGILGAATMISPESTSLENWREVMSVNLDGTFLGCRAGIKGMRRAGRGGSIINVCSVAANFATPFATAYGASKAGVRQLTKSVAQFCAEEKLDIRCNSLHPGDSKTPLHEKRAREQGVDFEVNDAAMKAVSPLRDWIPIEHISAAISYLASDDTRFMTGSMHIIDGGLVNLDSYHVGRGQAAQALWPTPERAVRS